MPDGSLLDVLAALRDRGAIGEPSLPDAVAHAERFLAAIGDDGAILDLGSGGGLPGLVIATALPERDVVLVDRRARRTDLLRWAVARLGLAHVTVVTADVVRLGTDAAWQGRSPTVTARAFGPPLLTLRCAMPFLHQPAGRIVVSEPPAGDPDRWPAEDVAGLGLEAVDSPAGVRVFVSSYG
jgi:16S rRNA (guanine527-N7)-methyltransferase